MHGFPLGGNVDVIARIMAQKMFVGFMATAFRPHRISCNVREAAVSFWDKLSKLRNTNRSAMRFYKHPLS
jgi:hypothetical protein